MDHPTHKPVRREGAVWEQTREGWVCREYPPNSFGVPYGCILEVWYEGSELDVMRFGGIRQGYVNKISYLVKPGGDEELPVKYLGHGIYQEMDGTLWSREDTFVSRYAHWLAKRNLLTPGMKRGPSGHWILDY